MLHNVGESEYLFGIWLEQFICMGKDALYRMMIRILDTFINKAKRMDESKILNKGVRIGHQNNVQYRRSRNVPVFFREGKRNDMVEHASAGRKKKVRKMQKIKIRRRSEAYRKAAPRKKVWSRGLGNYILL